MDQLSRVHAHRLEGKENAVLRWPTANDLLRLYYRLPYPLKIAAATAKGLQIRRWRYSAKTERVVEESVQRESWTRDQWTRWRAARLELILHRARTSVPYYREYWDHQRREGNGASPAYLENWPVLAKDVVRDHPKAFVADDAPRMYVDQTGGTTGRPTLVYQSKATVEQWYGLCEARLRRWHGVSHRDRWAMFGGKKVAALENRAPPYWVHNFGLNQLYFSIFHISRDSTPAYIEALRKFAPSHMIVFPSAVAVLAHHVIELGIRPPPLRVIISNSEKLLPAHRAVIETAFACPVIDTYGMAELTAASSECTDGTMHAWPEVGEIERLDASGSVASSGSGELVMTGLVNPDMPLIRYQNGDRGSVPSWETECRCGRTLPRFPPIDGRSNDLIHTSDGRELYILDSFFNGLPIIEGQLVQETLSKFRVRVVPGNAFALQLVKHHFERALEAYIGEPIEITVDVMEAIPRNENGKFPSYVSTLARAVRT